MIKYILVAIILFIIWTNWKQSTEEVGILGYKTKHFHLSHGKSKEMFEQMRADGLSPDSLKQFLMMEDRLLKIEQTSVCSGNSRNYEATAVSNDIKDAFVGYDFSYHTIHIKQVSEPRKFINQSLVC